MSKKLVIILAVVIVIIIIGFLVINYTGVEQPTHAYPNASSVELSGDAKGIIGAMLPAATVSAYATRDSLERVEAWYETELPKMGWELIEEIDGEELFFFGPIWRKNNDVLMVEQFVLTEMDVEDFIGVEPGTTVIVHFEMSWDDLLGFF